MTTTVYNLAADEQWLYSLGPEQALISAAIERDHRVSQLTEPAVREAYRQKIARGAHSMALDDFAVLNERVTP